MRKTLLVLLLSLVAGAAQAQIKCWTNKDGRRECGDTPPAGAKVRELRAPAAAPAPAQPAPGSAAAKDAKKGPATIAEREQAFRKRQLAEQEAREKEQKEIAAAAQKKENCARARESLRTMESGQRIARTDSKGERYFLDEKQIAAEATRAREQVQQLCN